MLKKIFPGRAAIVIAEIGLNHNGNFDRARAMIEAAHRSGAAAVKFQTFVPENMVSVYAASLLRDGREGDPDTGIIDFFSKLVFDERQYRALADYARGLAIEFFSSPFDAESVELLERVGIRLYKIASSEVTNRRLLASVGRTKKPVIMSTGIATVDEIGAAIEALRSAGAPEVALLHCVSLYPLDPKLANLNRIPALSRRFNCATGFSDHSAGQEASVVAAALGARIFEKHFMLGPDDDCPDRAVSLDPARFRQLVDAIESAIAMLGDGHISYDSSEKDVAISARRSIFADRDIPAGAVLAANDLTVKRPGIGIPASDLDRYIGRKTCRPIKKDHLLRDEHVE